MKKETKFSYIMLLFLSGMILGISLPQSRASESIPITPPGWGTWTWGIDINDTIGINATASIPEWTTTFDLLEVMRFNESTVALNTGVGNETAQFRALTQTGSTNAASKTLVDNPFKPQITYFFNVTEGYMGTDDIQEDLILKCIPLQNGAVNLTWVGDSMIAEVPGVENYHKLGMDSYRLTGGDTVEWYNSTSTPQEYINITYCANGSLSSGAFRVNFTGLGLPNGIPSINGSLVRLYDYSSFYVEKLDNTDYSVDVNDVMYFKKTKYHGSEEYFKATITDKYLGLVKRGDDCAPAMIINSTGVALNFSNWVPWSNDAQVPYGEQISAASNNDLIDYISPYGMMALAYPIRATGQDLVNDWAIHWAGLSLDQTSSGPLWANFSNVQGDQFAYIEFNSQRELLVYELDVNIPAGNDYSVVEYRYDRLFTWPPDWNNNQIIVQPGEELLYNYTQNTMTPSPYTSYWNYTIHNVENSPILYKAPEHVPGTYINASISNSTTVNGTFTLLTNSMNTTYMSENEAVFFYEAWPDMISNVFPIGTTGLDLQKYAYWFRLIIRPDSEIVGARSYSMYNATDDHWFNITVSPEGIMESVNANYSYESNGMNYRNFSRVLLNYTTKVGIVAGYSTGEFYPNEIYPSTNISFMCNFTNIGSHTVSTYFWDFGDGLNSSLGNATHKYSTTGIYYLNVTVTMSSGDVLVANLNITIIEAHTAAFFINYAPTQVKPNDTVTFSLAQTLTGSYKIASYSWNFGDSTTSTLGAPTHIYTVVGTYNVVVTITMDNGDVYTTNNTVRVKATTSYDTSGTSNPTATSTTTGAESEEPTNLNSLATVLLVGVVGGALFINKKYSKKPGKAGTK
jgi:PKD repeat protein